MKCEVLPHPSTVARAAATFIANQARQSIAKRGRFVVAFSGGSTPWQMLRNLASEEISWRDVYVVQVDERIAPAGDPDRNLTHLQESLLSHIPLPPEQVYAMPVEAEDLVAAADAYRQTLEQIAGSPPILDLVHLGLGSDGHTASLVPGDPVLGVADRDVATSAVYQGHRRMTLTFRILNRARTILWVVTGDSKTEMLQRLRDGDRTIPAGRVRRNEVTILADHEAASRRYKLKLENMMNKNMDAAPETRDLIEQLAGTDAVTRERSRNQLVQRKTPDVIRALLQAVIDPRTHVRWEAAKALQAIADPVAASALMHAMEDENADVRWVAAEGLIALKEVGLRTVLSGLITRAGSIEFRESAHHVLHESNGFAGVVAPVMKALGQSEPEVAAPVAAYQALVALNETPDAK
jgi:6-phosphogluconolactonase